MDEELRLWVQNEQPCNKPSSSYSDDNESGVSTTVAAAGEDGLFCSSTIERVAISTCPADQQIFKGALVLLCYIGLWVFGALVVPIGVLLFILKFWIPAGILIGTAIICWLVPLRPFPTLRRLCFRNFARYFPECSLTFERTPDPDHPTIVAITPHGIFSMAWAFCYLSEEFSHVRFCFSNLLRLNPYLRVLTECLGHPSSVKRSAVLSHMKAGRSIALIPGAWHEATIHTPSADRIWIRKRRGFVKYALQYGYSITPTYCFGEKLTYFNPQGCYKFRFWLNDRKIMAIVPFGQWWLPLMPRSCKLHVVIGEPLILPMIPNPTHTDVEKWHAAYIRAVEGIFNRHKQRCYGIDSEDKLEIW